MLVAGLFAHIWECSSGLSSWSIWDLLCVCLHLGFWWCYISRSGMDFSFKWYIISVVCVVKIVCLKPKTMWKCHVSLQLHDYRAEFSQWWTKEMKSIKLPAHGSVFDYYLDPQSRRFLPWTEKIPSFHMEPDKSLQVIELLSHGAESFLNQRKTIF